LDAHRGRIQAQGAKLEELIAWNQDKPLTPGKAKQMLSELKEKLNKKILPQGRTLSKRPLSTLIMRLSVAVQIPISTIRLW
jgi:hypothetical protein